MRWLSIMISTSIHKYFCYSYEEGEGEAEDEGEGDEGDEGRPEDPDSLVSSACTG